MPKDNLINLANDTLAKVVEIDGGHNMRHKLETIGLRVGSRVTKIRDAGGPVVVKVGRLQLAVGRGMASRVIVEKI